MYAIRSYYGEFVVERFLGHHGNLLLFPGKFTFQAFELQVELWQKRVDGIGRQIIQLFLKLRSPFVS